MIGYLRGTVSKPGVVETGGIGWAVLCPDPLVVGAVVELHVTTLARDGSMALYGFVDPIDQQLFDALLRVPRVGPSMAVAILATFTPGQLAGVIAANDASALAAAPGVGKKSAETICAMVALPAGVEPDEDSGSTEQAIGHDVVATLVDLGFDAHRCDEAVASLVAAGGWADEADLVRQALGLVRATS